MVACMFQVKRFYCEADFNFYNHLALSVSLPRNISVPPGGGVPWEIKSPGNVMNCPETNKKKLLIHPTPGGGGSQGNWGGGGKNVKSPGNFMNCRENRYIVVSPTPTQLVGGGGVRSQNWRDGWEEGLMGGREGCDGNYEVDPVHMAWNGCIILIGRSRVTS